MKQLLLVLAVVAVSMILLSVRVILKRNGRFSSQHIAQNKRMHQDKIHCAVSQDREYRHANKNKIDVTQM